MCVLDDRVKWFHGWSLWNHACEEHEILEEEFKRIICSYNRSLDYWISQGEKQTKRSRIYAYKQAAMLGCLSHDYWDSKQGT